MDYRDDVRRHRRRLRGWATRHIENLSRLLQIAFIYRVGLENSISRSRTLGFLAVVSAQPVLRGEMNSALQELEASLGT